MSFLHKVAVAAAAQEHRSYLAKVEAKYNIMETIKKATTKILKVALPTLIAFSATTGFAKIKDPDGLGKKFQEIASDTVGDTEIKTHKVNEEEGAQIIVYTVKYKGSGNAWGTASIKYTEGKGAKIATINSSDSIGYFAKSIVDTLNTIDEHGKKMAKENKTKPAKIDTKKMADNSKSGSSSFRWDK